MFKKRDSDNPYMKWLKSHPYIVLLTTLLGVAVYIDDVLTVWEKRVSPFFYDEVLTFEFRGDKITYRGTGDSLENAILITGASSKDAGVLAEYFWLRKKLPEYQQVSRSLIKSEPRKIKVDLYESSGKKTITHEIEESENSLRKFELFRLKKGNEVKDVFFDITEFYEKPIIDPFVNQILSETATFHKSIKE